MKIGAMAWRLAAVAATLAQQRIEQERPCRAGRGDRIAVGIEAGFRRRRVLLLLRRRRWQERRRRNRRGGDGRLGRRPRGQFELALAAAAGKAKRRGGHDKRNCETATMGQKPLPNAKQP